MVDDQVPSELPDARLDDLVGGMTQSDLDNGRLVAQIGVAAKKPAEFVIFKIGQKTADTRS
ncbi:MAG: hypothetical protein AAGH68_08765 [Pseudomonadota bacterium]